MPRPKKEHLKKRKDGRYACWCNGKFFIGPDEDQVLAERDAYRKALSEGIVPDQDIPTLSEYAKAWLKRTKINVADETYAGCSRIIEKLLKVCGNKLIRDVLPSDIKDVYGIHFAGLSDSYIKWAKQIYSGIFEAARADRLINDNPVNEKSAQPHKGLVGGHRAITAQERAWIHKYCTDHRAYPIVMAMLYEGLRPPEAKALDIDKDIDFKAGVIRLRHFVHRSGNNRYEVTEKGKTALSPRVIPLFSPFADAVRGKSGPLVSNADGDDLTVTGWKRLWNSYVTSMETAINGCHKRWYGKTREHKALIAAGKPLPPWIDFTVKPYDLRHSFCAMCRDNGIEIKVVMQMMGHSSTEMILRIYDEVSADRLQAEVNKLETTLKHSQKRSQKRYRLVRTLKNKAV